MYNKLFTKILDSSIWLEDVTTRIAWLTFIAAMDENGFVGFASIANLARRANVTEEEASKAVKVLESPDENSSDPDFEGRRIERIEGGWMVLNAEKYRDLVTRENIKEKTRARVAEFRKRVKCNAHVTQCNVSVTPSEAYTISNTEANTEAKKSIGKKIKLNEEEFLTSLKELPAYEGIDVSCQLSKMDSWLLANPGRTKTRRFIVNWLNRCEKPIKSETQKKTSYSFENFKA